jgi:hypothetical protein
MLVGKNIKGHKKKEKKEKKDEGKKEEERDEEKNILALKYYFLNSPTTQPVPIQNPE